MEELFKHRADEKEIESKIVETERVELSLLEGKIKEVLTMLKSLNSMVFRIDFNYNNEYIIYYIEISPSKQNIVNIFLGNNSKNIG